MSKYLNEIPKILQEDFLNNRVLPFVGAGFSKNAILPKGMSMPDWDKLGHEISDYIPNYGFTNALDALSLFESLYSRTRLIELMAELLHISKLEPGETHRAFCNIFSDTICTTNFDFLLENTLQILKRPHSIITSEDRLPINMDENTQLIKLHGDFNHPEKLVITENDYDLFIENNKILSTYVSNLFITKTLFLIGYSFDDADIRSIWKIINNRLGQLHRPAYTLLVDADPIEISRFERRNIKVINLKGKKEDYSLILNQLFIEIKELIDSVSENNIISTNEKAQEELKLPRSYKRLCFISAMSERLSFINELLRPILSEHNITTITLNDTILPSDNWMLRSEALINKCSLAIVDISGNSNYVNWELNTILNLGKKAIIISDRNKKIDLANFSLPSPVLIYDINSSNKLFFTNLENQLSDSVYLEKTDDPHRLLEKGEFNASVIFSFRLLEGSLRKYNSIANSTGLQRKNSSIYQMINGLNNSSVPNELITKVMQYSKIRNQIVHEANYNTNKKMATEIVNAIDELCKILDS